LFTEFYAAGWFALPFLPPLAVSFSWTGFTQPLRVRPPFLDTFSERTLREFGTQG